MSDSPEEIPSGEQTSTGGVFRQLKAILRAGGLLYLLLFCVRSCIARVLGVLERIIVGIEQRRVILEPWSLNRQRHTSEENRIHWNTHDWSARGEEWTKSEEWKSGLLTDLLFPNIAEDTTIVEVGPGGGRWTDILKDRVRQLYVVDVSEKALELCRDRFSSSSNITYLIRDGESLSIPDASIDAVWSYDVFVHINPADTAEYFRDFKRILKSGGRLMIHHPGNETSILARREGWRSDLTDTIIQRIATENGFDLCDQTTQYVNSGDVFSIFQKLPLCVETSAN